MKFAIYFLVVAAFVAVAIADQSKDLQRAKVLLDQAKELKDATNEEISKLPTDKKRYKVVKFILKRELDGLILLTTKIQEIVTKGEAGQLSDDELKKLKGYEAQLSLLEAAIEGELYFLKYKRNKPKSLEFDFDSDSDFEY